MYLNDSDKIFEIKLSDCYFIYIGEDNKEYPVLDILKSQRVFDKLSFISEKPILDGNAIAKSREQWNITQITKPKKYILIFADLKKEEYFYELVNICNLLDGRRKEIIIIVVNDEDLIFGKLRKNYSDFLDNRIVTSIHPDENVKSLQKSLGEVMYNLPLNHAGPNVENFFDDLEWELLLKYVKPYVWR